MTTPSARSGFIMSPVTSAIGMVAGAFKETDQHKHDEAYF